MGDVVKIKQWRRERADGKTLCGSGFHKWRTQSERRFDVKLGKLVTAKRCSRCGAERTKLT